MPERIQLRRTKGWRKPAGAVVVGRPTKWGNPYIVHEHTDRCDPGHWDCPDWPVDTPADAVRLYRHALQYPLVGQPPVPDLDDIRAELAGRDLACWCKPDQPCHADVLLDIAAGGDGSCPPPLPGPCGAYAVAPHLAVIMSAPAPIIETVTVTGDWL